MSLLVFSLVSIAVAKDVVLDVDTFESKAATYDKKTVTIKGSVSEYKKNTSKKGNAYTTLVLKGKKTSVNVYWQSHSKLDIKDGKTLTVTGIYRKEKTVGNRTFKNEIEVSAEKGKELPIKLG
ncbi:MAG: hypothetical protein JST40_09975 [Armatimonadetes bacterium]|nr:hypothetical protein [Armatimonadota bacterium]